MSHNDLSNPQVLANHIKSKIAEGDGKFSKRENVLVFTDLAGNQYIVPQELEVKVEEVIEKKKEEKTKAEAGKRYTPKK